MAEPSVLLRPWDRADPVFKDLDEDRGIAAIIKRLRKWVAMQDSETQRLYCEHGRYAGAEKALSFMCPGCEEELDV